MIGGKFGGPIDFDGNPFPDPAGTTDGFVVRYAADGSVAWARRIAGSGGVEVRGIAARSDGSAVVVGNYYDQAIFGLGPGQELMSAGGSWDIFVAMYTADGAVGWVKSVGNMDSDWTGGVSAFPDGSFVMTGGFEGTATFGAFPLTSFGDHDAFVARYNGDGSVAWAKSGGGTGDDHGNAVAALPDGACVIAGQFDQNATFEGVPLASSTDAAFIARYEADASLGWVQQVASIDASEALGAAGLPDGSVVVTGSYGSTAHFGPSGEITLTEVDKSDVFVARYAADGQIAWAKSAGGPSSDEGTCVAAFGNGSSIVAGIFSSTAVFGPGEANETALTAEGQTDAFVAHYGADGSL